MKRILLCLTLLLLLSVSTATGEGPPFLPGETHTSSPAFAQYFKEISPPIPQEYAEYFKVNGVLLPGYTIEGQEPEQSTKTAAEIISEITGGDSISTTQKPSVLKKLAESKTDKLAPSAGAKKKEEQSL